MINALLLIPTLACGVVGIYDPQATQVAMQGTVGSLQATITALETTSAAQAQPRPQPNPQIIVVTATPRPQPPTETATTSASPTPPATPTPTASPVGISQGQTIPTLTPTSITLIVATLTPTPTPNMYDNAPILTEPPEGTVVEEGREILLRWSWNGLLGANEHFDVKVRSDGQSRSAYVAWEEAEVHDFKANLPPGRYFWSVQVIKGYYRNDSGEPEDRVFEAYLSPESQPRLIIVAKKEERKTRTPTPVEERPTVPPDITGGTPDAPPPDDQADDPAATPSAPPTDRDVREDAD